MPRGVRPTGCDPYFIAHSHHEGQVSTQDQKRIKMAASGLGPRAAGLVGEHWHKELPYFDLDGGGVELQGDVRGRGSPFPSHCIPALISVVVG
jgi:hypothetical protein